MPLFINDMIGATQDLTMEQLGCYLSILMTTWAKGGTPFPDDNGKLSRVCRMSPVKFERNIRPALLPYFDLSGGTWRQHRLEKEWAYVEAAAQRARVNGAKGGRPAREGSTPQTQENEQKFSRNEAQEISENDLFSQPKSLKSLKTENPVGSSWDTQTESPQPQPHKKKESTPKPPEGAVSVQEMFDRFWGVKPSRGKASNSRAKALKVFKRRVEAEKVDPMEIIAGTAGYAQACRDEGIDGTYRVQQATTILGESRTWEQYLPENMEPEVDPETALWASRAAGFFRPNPTWLANWGPDPMSAGCRMPPAVIEEGWGIALQRYRATWDATKGREPEWPNHLGPRPGADGCRAPVADFSMYGVDDLISPSVIRLIVNQQEHAA
jgi:uncharacterized protein YdaU (DUF1376 family)